MLVETLIVNQQIHEFAWPAGIRSFNVTFHEPSPLASILSPLTKVHTFVHNSSEIQSNPFKAEWLQYA